VFRAISLRLYIPQPTPKPVFWPLEVQSKRVTSNFGTPSCRAGKPAEIVSKTCWCGQNRTGLCEQKRNYRQALLPAGGDAVASVVA
jgi:hypothetical protein